VERNERERAGGERMRRERVFHTYKQCFAHHDDGGSQSITQIFFDLIDFIVRLLARLAR